MIHYARSMMSGWCPLVGSLASITALILLVVTPTPSPAQQTCWTLGTTQCGQQCGNLGTQCDAIACTGIVFKSCPSDSNQNQATVPGATATNTCSSAARGSSDCWNQGVGGPTLWCTNSFPCGTSGCYRDPVSGGYFCDPPDPGANPTGSRCGIATCILRGGACPSS
jgi:hypothetical protein